MQIVDMKQNSEQWHDFRRGKISGTSLGQLWQARQYTKDDIVKLFESEGREFKKSAKKSDLEEMLTDDEKAILAGAAEKKLEFYSIMADKLANIPDDEPRMDRGHRLEDVAAQWFSEATGKQLIQVGCCTSDVDDRIINSPDRLVAGKKPDEFTEAVEIKCLAPARHLQAIIENEVPDEFFTQKVQYFVVNEKLERLYFVFYDERFNYPNLRGHIIEVTRESLGDWPKIMLDYQLIQLKEMDAIIERLAF